MKTEEDCTLPAAGVAFTPPPREFQDEHVGWSYECGRCCVWGRVPPRGEKVCWLCGEGDRMVDR